jgi:hypothetical protein
MAKPSDVKKVTLTRSEWNLLDAAIDPTKRANLQPIIDKLMDQVGQ